MTKFYISHPYFQGISLPYKVFVKHRETDASYKQHWITLLVVPTNLRRFSMPLQSKPSIVFVHGLWADGSCFSKLILTSRHGNGSTTPTPDNESKAAMQKRKGNATNSSVLKWDVFVTPGIPVGTPDQPAGITETLFQAMASTLIYGERDAVLVDTFMTVKQATELADWVESKGKNLTTIYITHGHGDHCFGAGTILKRFPKARLVATPSSIKVMEVNSSPQVLDGVWKLGFPGQIPDNLVIAHALKGNLIDLEGHELVVVELGHTDTD